MPSLVYAGKIGEAAKPSRNGCIPTTAIMSSSSSKPRPKRDASVSSSSSSYSSSRNSPTKQTAPLLPPPLSSAPTARSKSPLPPTTPPLHITIRFSTSLPDLELDIPSPSTTTVVALKHLIRQRLTPSSGSHSNIRFIHNGRILPDSSPLSTVFRSLPPPPPLGSDPKGKGKDIGLGEHQLQRVFVNCSIGHALSAEELKEEEKAATKPVTGGETVQQQQQQQKQQNERNGREPRGFDRLAGSLSREEILNLRLTFRGYHAARYTPDNMPSAERMLELEDAWLDNGSSGGFATQEGEGGQAGQEEGEGWAGNVDLLVKGMAIGFVFPLGVVGWLLREEGLWSKRMGVFVSLGVLLGVLVGFVREFPGH
ncbi:DUF2407 C-terminal domain-containing protein [Triangularia verruculosa]|uniref:DUF2407 C-terminal domain-containing protein n=1 Tax=Triangularia verruculosa TaxID=2587418 RepID=A0AAN7AYX7_9PEZI|nr:DUF2407 C-terminal domain-containing protein [Triangularia verruculosa]